MRAIRTINDDAMTEMAGGELCLPQRPHNYYSKVGAARNRSMSMDNSQVLFQPRSFRNLRNFVYYTLLGCF